MKTCQVSKGSIHYEVVGSGLPILFLHSMGSDHRSMKWLEPVFQKHEGFQRIYIDLPAHGLSTINKDLKTSDDILLNILDFIDATIPNQPFSLIGISYGGYLAQAILHHRQKSVKGICLLAPAIHLKERNLPQKVVYSKDREMFNQIDSDIRVAFETLFIHQHKENLAYFLNEIQPGRLLANKEFLQSNWREHGYLFTEEPFNDVSSLSQVALVILGKQDSICGYQDHYFLLDKFSNCTFSILDQAGHMLHIEKRSIVQSLIRDWLPRINQH
ncbi:pimeloyl-ACP methyl ester carboxylesterase [Bacillus mesophilus]|uniref:Alpha/beta hydrolase n=1 Tax=Bacillus mesophilus TaxID=1808955 RepID=A0A6M0QB87_9BACI|nr:alpha/beta hydrolase [Bacillus mesophilus]MBM7663108.1 pimeloyl-ACP methyl ester carboxylesterase [Bacillus mesophilus]NEY73573.1 alpha/beta hydrolase [Bacillus mesophilus]